jgi:MoaA/NifB/PqqE/SkfB family radical SAM enzyme
MAHENQPAWLGNPTYRPPTSAEVYPKPLAASDFASDSVDIYTNTLCYGAGDAADPRLCNYCFLTTGQLKDPTMMGPETYEEILTWITQPNSNIHTISLLGGEFALNPNADTMIYRAYREGLNIHIVTNGSKEFRELLDNKDIVEMLRDPEYNNLVAVSLDAVTPSINDAQRGIGASKNAQTTIEELRSPGKDSFLKGGIPFRINATLTRPAMDGLKDLCGFAKMTGAESVLIHFPSDAGRGRSLSKQRNSLDYTKEISRDYAEWSRVLRWVQAYRQRTGLQVECEMAYLALGGEHNCAMAQRTSSLQFAPRTSATNPDIPVVACGLNMDKANTESAYLLRNGTLYERANPNSELHRASPSEKEGCPLRSSQAETLGCIYTRLVVAAPIESKILG